MSVLEQTAAFLLTDLVGSTRLHQDHPNDMVDALRQHAAIVADAVAAEGGELFKRRGEGDSTFSVFKTAPQAVRAAIAIQRGLESVRVTPEEPLRTRIGVHFGTALLFDSDYQGAVVNLCARIRSVAHGGQILISEAVRQQISGVDVKDLGFVRLADVHERQRVYQVCADGLPSDFPGIRSLDIGGLPKPATAFVGRVSEVEALDRLVRDQFLVTVTGLGGIGKTRLAIQVAGELAPKFAAGLHFLRVEEGSTDSEMAAAIFAEISKDRSDRPLQALSAVFHREPHLVVLDNAEVATSAVASLLQQVATPDGASRWIVTSREVLNVPGEACYPIGPMSLPDGNGMGDAAAMLMSGIKRAAPKASVSTEDLAQICWEASGIPLCLELIAPHFRSLASNQIIERFEILINRERDELGPRHRSIQAALETSLQLLSAAEREVFFRLGVFAGSFSLEAAEVVIGFGCVAPAEVLPAIQGLVDASLVTAELETGRFRLLDQVRRFGLRSPHYRDAHRDLMDRSEAWLSSFVADRCTRLGEARGREFAADIGLEVDNLRSLLEERIAEGNPPLQLVADMALWWYKENPHQGWRYLSQIVSFPLEDSLLSMTVLNRSGVLAYAINDWVASQRLLNQAKRIAVDLGDQERLFSIQGNLALAMLDGGNPAEAMALLDSAVTFYRETNFPILETRLMVNLARAQLEYGDVDAARNSLIPTLVKAHELGLEETAALALVNLGETYLLACEPDPWEAARCLFRAMQSSGRLTLANRTFGMVLLAIALDELGEGCMGAEVLASAEDLRKRFGVPVFDHELRHFATKAEKLSRKIDSSVAVGTPELTLSRAAAAVGLQFP